MSRDHVVKQSFCKICRKVRSIYVGIWTIWKNTTVSFRTKIFDTDPSVVLHLVHHTQQGASFGSYLPCQQQSVVSRVCLCVCHNPEHQPPRRNHWTGSGSWLVVIPPLWVSDSTETEQIEHEVQRFATKFEQTSPVSVLI